VTWEYGGEVSWVDVRLEPDGQGSTLLELEHAATVPDELWDEYGPGAVGVGWDQALLGLANHLAAGAAVNPEEAVAWLGTDQGRDFVHRQRGLVPGVDPGRHAGACGAGGGGVHDGGVHGRWRNGN
jgi:hypothetical protein